MYVIEKNKFEKKKNKNRKFQRSTLWSSETILIFVHEKNGFAEISKNLVRYRSENNFVGPSK